MKITEWDDDEIITTEEVCRRFEWERKTPAILRMRAKNGRYLVKPPEPVEQGHGATQALWRWGDWAEWATETGRACLSCGYIGSSR